MTFGQRLRQLRLERKINQRDLAAQVGIDFTYLSKIENERMPPPAEATILKIANVLEADSDELLRLAQKVPTDIKPLIAKRPEMPAFLRSISDLTEEELKRLTHYAQRIKQERSKDTAAEEETKP